MGFGCNCHRKRKQNTGSGAAQQRMARRAADRQSQKENDRQRKIDMVRRLWEESKNPAEGDENEKTE